MTYSLNNSSNLKEPVIALDLDGVCSKTRYGFIDRIEDRYNITVPRERFYNRSLNVPEISNSYSYEVGNIIKEDPSIYRNFDEVSGAALATRTLSHSHEIWIVSSRFSTDWLDDETRAKVFDITKEWLDNKNFSYDRIINPLETDKLEVAADIFIDDTPEVLLKIDDTQRLPMLYLRPHNMDDIPRSCWNASTYSGKTVEDLVQNPQEQWRIITQYLRDR